MEELSPYELEREQNIARNNAMLAGLMRTSEGGDARNLIDGVQSNVERKAKQERKPRAKGLPPQRRSTRIISNSKVQTETQNVSDVESLFIDDALDQFIDPPEMSLSKKSLQKSHPSKKSLPKTTSLPTLKKPKNSLPKPKSKKERAEDSDCAEPGSASAYRLKAYYLIEAEEAKARRAAAAAMGN